MSTTEAPHAPAEAVALGPHEFVALCSCGKRFRGTTASKARAKLDTHAAERNPNPCPTPGKTPFDTRDDAEAALGRAWARQGPGRRPTRVYRCPGCSAWHLTAKPVRGGRDR